MRSGDEIPPPAKKVENPRTAHRKGKESKDEDKGFNALKKMGTSKLGSWEEAMKVRRCSETGMLFPDQQWSPLRRFVEKVITHKNFEPVVGMVVVCNFIGCALEADIRSGAVSETPPWLRPANLAFISFYTAEAASRMYVERWVYFTSAWNNFDFVIVTFGLVGEIVEGSLDSVSVLRTIRLARLLRVARLFTAFTELWALIRGLLGCMRTLVWAVLLMFITTTVWSIFAVEMISPLMSDIEESGAYQDCDWCGHAFASVMHANLTFFQIISGDGWSALCRPIIEKHWWTALIFLGVIFTMTLGLMNLITAVIVDNAAQGRQADLRLLAMERESQRKAMKGSLLEICQGLDKDGDGTVSLHELRIASVEMEEFKHVLKVMDIGTDDLDYVFEILDTDGSGDVTHEEFADQLWKMRSQEANTILSFIRHQVGQIWKIAKQGGLISPQPGIGSPEARSPDHRERRPSTTVSLEDLQMGINDLRCLLTSAAPAAAMADSPVRQEGVALGHPNLFANNVGLQNVPNPVFHNGMLPEASGMLPGLTVSRGLQNVTHDASGAAEDTSDGVNLKQLFDVSFRLNTQLEELSKLQGRLEQSVSRNQPLEQSGIPRIVETEPRCLMLPCSASEAKAARPTSSSKGIPPR